MSADAAHPRPLSLYKRPGRGRSGGNFSVSTGLLRHAHPFPHPPSPPRQPRGGITRPPHPHSPRSPPKIARRRTRGSVSRRALGGAGVPASSRLQAWSGGAHPSLTRPAHRASRVMDARALPARTARAPAPKAADNSRAARAAGRLARLANGWQGRLPGAAPPLYLFTPGALAARSERAAAEPPPSRWERHRVRRTRARRVLIWRLAGRRGVRGPAVTGGHVGWRVGRQPCRDVGAASPGAPDQRTMLSCMLWRGVCGPWVVRGAHLEGAFGPVRSLDKFVCSKRSS
jgi:hypothetical protein